MHTHKCNDSFTTLKVSQVQNEFGKLKLAD